MSVDFAVVQFDGEGTAVKRYADAKDRARSDAPWTQKVGFVEHHHNGRLLLRGLFAGHYLDVDESDHVSQRGGAEGAVAGGLVGVLLGPPGIALGFVVGGIAGAKGAAVSDSELEPQDLADQLRVVVPKSSSAIVLIAPPEDVDEMLSGLGASGEGVTRQTLDSEQTAQLEASLGEASPGSPQP